MASTNFLFDNNLLKFTYLVIPQNSFYFFSLQISFVLLL